jgi:hypothetical protein
VYKYSFRNGHQQVPPPSSVAVFSVPAVGVIFVVSSFGVSRAFQASGEVGAPFVDGVVSILHLPHDKTAITSSFLMFYKLFDI